MKVSWWRTFSVEELEKIKKRKKQELDDIMDNETNHTAATERGVHLAEDITNIDAELRTRE